MPQPRQSNEHIEALITRATGLATLEEGSSARDDIILARAAALLAQAAAEALKRQSGKINHDG